TQSPAVVHQRANVLVVDALDCRHGFRGERWNRGRLAVVTDLVWAFAAGDSAANGVEHQDPAQRELAHRRAGRHQLADLLDGFEGYVVVHAGEGLAYIERCAVAVEVAVVVGGEGRVAAELAGEQAAGQRDAGKNADLLLLRLREEDFGGTLPEAVEDDLHGLDIGILDRFQGLFDLLDADAVVADFPRFHEVVEDGEDFRAGVEVRRRTVELEQVERVAGEV